MDPEATIQHIIDALDSDDYKEAASAGDDLRSWREHGGFIPFGATQMYLALEAACYAVGALGEQLKENS